MITGRNEKKDISVDISDDPLDALTARHDGPYAKIYCVNRYAWF